MRSDGGKLRGRCEPCDAMAQMAEVLGTDLEPQDLFNAGREVRQREQTSAAPMHHVPQR